MASPRYVSPVTETSASITTQSLGAIPHTIVPGVDVIVVVASIERGITSSGTVTTIPTVSGGGGSWTQLQGDAYTDCGFSINARVAAEADKGTTITVSTGANARRLAGGFVVMPTNGVLPTIQNKKVTTFTDVTMTGPSITPAGADAGIISVFAAVEPAAGGTIRFVGHRTGYSELLQGSSRSTTGGNAAFVIGHMQVEGGAGVAQTGDETDVDANGRQYFASTLAFPAPVAAPAEAYEPEVFAWNNVSQAWDAYIPHVWWFTEWIALGSLDDLSAPPIASDYNWDAVDAPSPVASWTDRRKGLVLSNGSTTQQPTKTTNGVFGLPSASFDMSNDYLSNSAGTATLGRNVPGITVLASFRTTFAPTDTATHQLFYCATSGSITANRVSLRVASNKIAGAGRRRSTDSNQIITGATTITAGQDKVGGVVLDYLNNKARVYLDGVPDSADTDFQTGTGAGTNSEDTNPLTIRIGANGSQAELFGGLVGKIHVYHRPLSPVEVASETEYLKGASPTLAPFYAGAHIYNIMSGSTGDDATVNAQAAADFGVWQGRTYGGWLEFMASDDGWGGLNGYTDQWAGLDKLPVGVKRFIKVPMLPSSTGFGTTPDTTTNIRTGATGAYNQYWANIGVAVAAKTNPQDYIICPGWEHNGNWFRWGLNGNEAGGNPSYGEGKYQQGYEEWAEYYRQVVTTMRAQGYPTLQTAWSPNMQWSYNTNLPPVENSWPGDSYVDWVGLSAYDAVWEVYDATTNPRTTTQHQTAWNSIRYGHSTALSTRKRGLQWSMEFALEHGCDWGVFEWSSAPVGAYHGGGDNPIYVDGMFDMFEEARTLGMAVLSLKFDVVAHDGDFLYWQKPNSTKTTIYPNSAQRFRDRTAAMLA